MMVSKEACPNTLVFSHFGDGTVISHKEGFDHLTNGLDMQLINKVCPVCVSHDICTYKDELVQNLSAAKKRYSK